MLVCKYTDGMVATKRSASALELNLRILLHAGDEASKATRLALEPRTDINRSTKQKYQSFHKKSDVLQITKKKVKEP